MTTCFVLLERQSTPMQGNRIQKPGCNFSLMHRRRYSLNRPLTTNWPSPEGRGSLASIHSYSGTKEATVLLRLSHFGLTTRHHSVICSVALRNQIQSDSHSEWISAIKANLLVCDLVWALQSSPDRLDFEESVSGSQRCECEPIYYLRHNYAARLLCQPVSQKSTFH